MRHILSPNKAATLASLALAFASTTFASQALARSELQAGDTLTSGQSMQSADGRLYLTMLPSGNLAMYFSPFNTWKQVIWETHTAGNPGAHAAMQRDGNFVVYSASGAALWSTATHVGSFIEMQNDGNLVVYNAGGSPLWSSGTAPQVPPAASCLESSTDNTVFCPAGTWWETCSSAGYDPNAAGNVGEDPNVEVFCVAENSSRVLNDFCPNGAGAIQSCWNNNGTLICTPTDSCNPLPAATGTPTTRVGEFFNDDDGTNFPSVSYGRGAGTIPATCPAGYENSGLLCVQNCPSGYTDTGLLCTASPVTTSCSSRDAIGACTSCPAHYSNAGFFCTGNTFAKANDGSPTCGAGEEEQAGLCYPLCEAGYSGVGPVCWLGSISSGDVCKSLYDTKLAKAAISGKVAMSFGVGAGMALGATLSTETGVVYGEGGQYGCYTTTCNGSTSDTSVTAWGAFDTFLSFDAVAGPSTVPSMGASGDIVGWSEGLIIDDNGAPVGYTSVTSVGVGQSPVQLGFNICQTTVTQLW